VTSAASNTRGTGEIVSNGSKILAGTIETMRLANE
jgi:hypothetical protein